MEQPILIEYIQTFAHRRHSLENDAPVHKHAYPFIYDITTRVALRSLIYRRILFERTR